MTDSPLERNEGHSPAAWVAVGVMLLGFSTGTLALFVDVMWALWASVALIVIGAVAGGVLAKLGWGANGRRYGARKNFP